ncbi:putative Ig domain-containing protein, partial [Staphylococcus epidermidis]|nr:putative Ig domain-containing protein [Staphylococcus epidermidis]
MALTACSKFLILVEALYLYSPLLCNIKSLIVISLFSTSSCFTDGVTFDEATNTISGTPSEVGSYDITVTTTDESGNATETT